MKDDLVNYLKAIGAAIILLWLAVVAAIIVILPFFILYRLFS